MDINTTIVSNIFCKKCEKELPPMTMAEHLGGRGCPCQTPKVHMLFDGREGGFGVRCWTITQKNVKEVVEEIKEIYGDDITKHLKEPSGLGHVLLMSDWWNDKWRVVSFKDTTVEQAIDKIIRYYRHKTYRRGVGDHIFFEGFSYGDKNKDFLRLRLGS
jgi:hypothetical protein